MSDTSNWKSTVRDSLLLVCGICGGLICVGALGFFFIGHSHIGRDWSDKEAVNFFLGALTLLVTILGLFIAIGALIGYEAIKRAGSQRAKEGVDAYLKSDEFRSLLKDHVNDAVAEAEGLKKQMEVQNLFASKSKKEEK